MRFVVFGAGAIGGVVGACVHQSGHEVALIARGEHGRAIRERGLTFERPGDSITLRSRSRTSPDELEWSGDEVVLLATKSQDTAGALADLRARRPGRRARGVRPERGRERADRAAAVPQRLRGGGDDADRASRAGDRPGVRDPRRGVIDVGRYPTGLDRCARGGGGVRRGGLQLPGAAGHHALQVRQAAGQPGNAVDAIASRAGRRGAHDAGPGGGAGGADGGRDRVRGRGGQRRHRALAAPRHAADRGPAAGRLLDPPELRPGRVHGRDRLSERRDLAVGPPARRAHAGQRRALRAVRSARCASGAAARHVPAEEVLDYGPAAGHYADGPVRR